MTGSGEHTLRLCALGLCAGLAACGSTQGAEKGASAAGAGGLVQAGAPHAAGGEHSSVAGSSVGGSSVGGSAATSSGGGSSLAGGGSAGNSSASLAGAGQGPVDNAPALALPGASDFTRLTLHDDSYIQMGSNGECQLEDPSDSRQPYEGTWVFVRASHVLSWDTCNPSSKMLEKGSVTLTDTQFQSLLQQLALVVPTQRTTADPCRADGWYVEMDVEAGETTTRYRASSGWCGTPPPEKNYVDGLLGFASWVIAIVYPH